MRNIRSPGLVGALVLLSACASDAPDASSGSPFEEQAIVNGWNATRGDQPWLAALYSQDIEAIDCGATLVHPRFVLTAAHCFFDFQFGRDPARVVVQFNEYGTTERPDFAVEQQRRIRRVHMHPSYRPRTSENDPLSSDDLALVELASPVTVNEHVQPIAITGEVADGYRVLGWGDTTGRAEYATTLQEGWVNARDDQHCIDAGLRVGPNEFCAGSPVHGLWVQDTCGGDSGGPVLVGDWGASARLTGVVSRGAELCQGAGVYTRVEPYLPWIQSVTGPL